MSHISQGSNRTHNQGFGISSVAMNSNRMGSNLGMSEEFEDLYQNDLDSNYNEYNSHLN